MLNEKLQKAIQLHQAGELERASEIYQELLKKNPKNSNILYLLGIIAAQQQNNVMALNYFQKGLNYSPKSIQLNNAIGNIYKRLRQYQNAKKYYYLALKQDPTNASTYNNLGSLYYYLEKFDKSKNCYQNAIKFNANNPDTHFNLGTLYAKQNHIISAISELKKAINLAPRHQQAHAQLVKLLYEAEKYDEAIKHSRLQLGLHPLDKVTRNYLASAQIKQGELEAGIENYKKILETNPNDTQALSNLGNTYLALNRPDLALFCYSRLLLQNPNRDVYYNLGVINMHQDHHQEAIKYFKEALKLDPNHFDSLINIAATYLKQEDHVSAIHYYQEAKRLQSDNAELNYILIALNKKSQPQHPPSEYIERLFDQYAPHYDKHLIEFLHYKVPELLYKTVDEILDFPKNTLTIVDLGCGTGLCGPLFKPLAKKLIGIDLSSNMIKVAEQKKCYDELIVEDVHYALTTIKQIDLFIAADVLGYIGDLDQLFSLLHQTLTSQGFFAFTVEKTYEHGYMLQPSARYAHSKTYIEELTNKYDFILKQCDNVEIRTQKKKPVEGYLFILQKHAKLS